MALYPAQSYTDLLLTFSGEYCSEFHPTSFFKGQKKPKPTNPTIFFPLIVSK